MLLATLPVSNTSCKTHLEMNCLFLNIQDGAGYVVKVWHPCKFGSWWYKQSYSNRCVIREYVQLLFVLCPSIFRTFGRDTVEGFFFNRESSNFDQAQDCVSDQLIYLILKSYKLKSSQFQRLIWTRHVKIFIHISPSTNPINCSVI